jgi:hypothetical protein
MYELLGVSQQSEICAIAKQAILDMLAAPYALFRKLGKLRALHGRSAHTQTTQPFPLSRKEHVSAFFFLRIGEQLEVMLP